MRRFMKFAHTMGSIGLIGSMAALVVLALYLPEPSAIGEYARLRAAMGGVATWLFFPSLFLTLLSGLAALALNRAYLEAVCALAKLAFGFILFEGGLIAIQGPMQREAILSAEVLKGAANLSELGQWLMSEWQTLWLMIVIATISVALGIWRPQRLWPS